MLPKNVLRMGHLFFRAFISLANQIMKENIYCQNIGENKPIQQQPQVFCMIQHAFAQGSSKLPKS